MTPPKSQLWLLPTLTRSDHDALHGPTTGFVSLVRIARRTLTEPSLRAVLLLRLTVTVPHWVAILPRNALIMLHQIDCEPPVTVGPGLRLPNPTGIVLGRVSIGKDVTIQDAVTIASRTIGVRHPPLHVGDDVSVASGTSIIMDGDVPSGVALPANHFVDDDSLAAITCATR